MFAGLKRFVAAELRQLADLVERGSDRIAVQTEEIRTLTAAVIRLEALLENFVERWSWPNEVGLPSVPQPLPTHDPGEATPLEPRRRPR